MRKSAALILTHGRPDHVRTISTLTNGGYTGRIVLVVDDEDKRLDEYLSRYGDQCYVFSKREVAKHVDSGDNSGSRQVVFYARNVCFKVARDLGLTHFVQLDDDYGSMGFRFAEDMKPSFYRRGDRPTSKNLDDVFDIFWDFVDETPALSITMAQGGDFIGGARNPVGRKITFMRKAMNSFFCRTDRPFKFVGRINEDVNTYVLAGSRGDLLCSTSQFSLGQGTTQANEGGMTATYLKGGTYIKSFYSVMYHPSSVTIGSMGDKFQRMHHTVSWRNTVVKILPEVYRKPRKGKRKKASKR